MSNKAEEIKKRQGQQLVIFVLAVSVHKVFSILKVRQHLSGAVSRNSRFLAI